ncbi:exodeoxyribonuclease V subunit beta [Flavobacterium sp.]|uniref:UvrD-helicase domain-containing protein n=1 Tax=Flavobacterium sp. TaxID=239 RepID=UPI00260DA535|nr:UvrD-helicase domain-containing protein [Flavobacterium sp.]
MSTTPAFNLYDASAGSGKTYTLVKSYLKIILLAPQPDAYRSILAITFTNKAVHEMKSRVVESLSQFAALQPSAKAQDLLEDIAAETGMSTVAIQDKSRLIIKNLIHNYAAFDISTIDKFTHKVIRSFAHELKLPITFEVSLDTDGLLQEAVDAIIAQAGEDETLTQLLVNFTMEKTDEDKSWDISREIIETGKLMLNENNREEIQQLQDKSIEDFIVLKEKLVELRRSMEETAAQEALYILGLLENNGVDLKSFSRATFPNHLKSIAQKNFNTNQKTYREAEAIQINKTASDRALIESFIPEIMSHLTLMYGALEKMRFYNAFLKNVTPLSLFNTLQKKLKVIQEAQNILSITEFNTLIQEQIQQQPAPFIYEKLGEKYRHFFIDEFQDTSELQWHNLIPLIDNALAGEENGVPGSLLLVGDPKQSIYRWRGGKAEQFIALGKGEIPFSNKDFARKTLDTNYRSYSQIIEFNNDFFQFLSGKFQHPDYQELYANYSFQKTNSKKGGYVQFEFLPGKAESSDDEEVLEKDDLYLEALVNTIDQIRLQGFAYRDIAILIRGNKKGALIAQYLTEKQLPIISSESLLLAASAEVRVLVASLRFLNNAKDQEAKANVLYYLACHFNPTHVHECIAEGMAKTLETDWERWLSTRFGSTFSHFSLQNLRKKSLYEVVEYVSHLFIPPSKHHAYVQFFQDVVLEHDLRKQAGIADFLAFWERQAPKLSIASPEGNDAIRIMTIHKSKGLEFPVVIFPFAEEDFSRNKHDKLWLDLPDAALGIPKALVTKNKEVETFSPEAAAVYTQRKEEELLDNINVLYVAMTRAEEQLFVISAENRTNKGELPSNLSSFFLSFLESKGYRLEQGKVSFGNPLRLSTPDDLGITSMLIPKVEALFSPSNIKIAQRESLMWNTKQGDAIAYGNLVHELLASVATMRDIEMVLAKAIEEGVLATSQRDLIQQTLLSVVTHPELDEFFSEKGRVYNEQTFLLPHGPVFKPDRVVVFDDQTAVLLDYKTGSHKDTYRAQVEGYQTAIEAMGWKVRKKCLVYIGEHVEVVHLQEQTN